MSADGHILVTFAAVNEGAADADTIAGRIEQQLSDLKAYIKPLVGSWSGQASSDYQVLQQKWDTSAEDLNQVLKQIAQALRVAAQNYQREHQLLHLGLSSAVGE
jgi:early secretory antigenic target protein ESAT-6